LVEQSLSRHAYINLEHKTKHGNQNIAEYIAE